eukprot:15120069-Alexandrium_andersonii.AAC.1
MDLAALLPTLTPRGNPLGVVLDFILQWRVGATGEDGALAPAARVYEECSRHGFSRDEAADALETWRRPDIVREEEGGMLALRASQ